MHTPGDSNSRLCTGIWSGSGVEAIQWDCNNNEDQRWYRVGDGI